MRVQARTVTSAAELDRLAGAFLRRRAGQHNLLLGLVERLLVEPRLYGYEPFLAVAELGAEIVGVALCTPPYGLVLSEVGDLDAVGALADVAAGDGVELPYVVASTGPARRFAEAWARLTGCDAVLAVRERIHACTAVAHAGDAPGVARPVDRGDRDLLATWLRAFVVEALGEGRADIDVESRVGDYLDPTTPGRAFLWLDPEPVSLAACGPGGPRAARVGPVYTPAERRGRGYATALVARVTGELLSSGNDACYLYTDLANPTSNAIYARIGYEPLADADEWRFQPAVGDTGAVVDEGGAR